MIQEIHFKLLRRVTEKRGEIRDSNWDICPKIKKILDANIMQSRKWRAVWDGESKYQVNYNTRFVTVDLDSRSCDCRNFDLTGMPCSHALAAIYDRRGQPVDYLSDYYKRDKYAAAYAFPLTALKGVDYWDFHDDEVLLPPELPKKLRGRPKRLRKREEWEGGTQGKAKVKEEQVQRWSSKRVHHCSKCKNQVLQLKVANNKSLGLNLLDMKKMLGLVKNKIVEWVKILVDMKKLLGLQQN